MQKVENRAQWPKNTQKTLDPPVIGVNSNLKTILNIFPSPLKRKVGSNPSLSGIESSTEKKSSGNPINWREVKNARWKCWEVQRTGKNQFKLPPLFSPLFFHSVLHSTHSTELNSRERIPSLPRRFKRIPQFYFSLFTRISRFPLRGEKAEKFSSQWKELSNEF